MRRALPQLARTLFREVPRKQQPVGAALTQRRHLDRNDAQAVVEVSAELATLDSGRDIALRRADVTDVGTCHALVRPLLEDIEQPHLYRRRELGHFVQE